MGPDEGIAMLPLHGVTPFPGRNIHTVFSTDASRYQYWQAQVLAHTHRTVGQPGGLTRLLSTTGPMPSFAGETFAVRPHPDSDVYLTLNRLSALVAWLATSPPREDVILHLDPDCVFLAPVRLTVTRGRPASQYVWYLDVVETHADLIRRHCLEPARVQPVGIPTVIHRDDFAQLAPRWLAKTERLRADPEAVAAWDWVCDMWAYCFVAAELGLRHDVREDLAHFPDEDAASKSLVHYCYPVHAPDGSWQWDKRYYRPWDPIPIPPASIPAASRAVVAAINEVAAANPFSLAEQPAAPRPRRGGVPGGPH
jgi:hypothetical protein